MTSSSSAERRGSACGATDKQRALDLVWRSIDALGGTYSPEEQASGFAEAHMAALDAACLAVEALGGRPN